MPTKFKVSGFTRSKVRYGVPKFKKTVTRDPDYAPLGVLSSDQSVYRHTSGGSRGDRPRVGWSNKIDFFSPIFGKYIIN